jgi:hypothetical protein
MWVQRKPCGSKLNNYIFFLHEVGTYKTNFKKLFSMKTYNHFLGYPWVVIVMDANIKHHLSMDGIHP